MMYFDFSYKELRFINDSPRVEGNNISADIQTSRPVASMLCALTGLPRQDCKSALKR